MYIDTQDNTQLNTIRITDQIIPAGVISCNIVESTIEINNTNHVGANTFLQ